MQERRSKIVDIINSQGAVSFTQLKNIFYDVSEMTIRNDLRALDEARLIVRVHGGAKSVERIIATDDLLNRRLARNIDKKKSIAQKALSLLFPGTSLFLDSGSTVIELAKVFPDQSHLVITSGIHCAAALAELKQVKVFMLGGTLNAASMSVNGASCCNKIREMNFDTAFLGATGYMTETGFTCGHDEESELKKNVISRAETKIILMDSTKIGINNTFSFAALKDIDVIVTDDDIDKDTATEFKKMGVKIL